MSNGNYLRSYVAIGIISWIGVLTIELLKIYLQISTPDYVTDILLTFFYAVTFLTFRHEIGNKKSSNFNEYLWQVFIIGGSTILISLFIKFFFYIIDKDLHKTNILLENVLYHINIGLIIIFLANGFYVWKKMILYQKNKVTEICWKVFEGLVLFSILSNFFHSDIFNLRFIIFAAPITLLGTFLSFNLKWVAFLNYKQKWQSILLIFLIIIISFTFLQQIFEQRLNEGLQVNLANNIFIVANFSFLLMNCFFSLLVLLFHLPTSSVFEQKFGEVMIFQRLSQSIQMGNKEEEVYKMLIDSSISTVMADAGWLEIVNEKGNYTAFLNREINEFDVFELKKVLRKNNLNINTEPHYIKDIKNYSHTEKLANLSYKSLLIIPLSSHNQKLGTLVLLKNLNDGFDKGMVDIIFSFVSQASMAIKNFRLISEAIEHERYKEERKIAKDVQKSLFPEHLLFNIHVEMTAFTKAADEVGGDYYDVFEFSQNKIAVVIGDVSGNGTSAAFNMAQMKGVFHSLIQLNLPADSFMNYANNALSRCLEKTSFITLSLFIVDVENQSIQFARAGHCPALYYNTVTNETSYLKSKGLGLGIIRNNGYLKHIQNEEFSYNKGDVMILYTDGIVEANNNEQEEYGYDRLKILVENNVSLNSKQLSDKIVEDVYQFTGTKYLNDDYSFLILKFI
jgi:serine phosphatase RsbU (regulator of sigma subunit)